MLGDEKGWDEQAEVRTGSGEESVQRDYKAGDRNEGGEGEQIRRTRYFI